MPPRILKREAAKRDLILQWLWYAENAGTEVADQFLRAAESTLELLAAHPQSGTALSTSHPRLQGIRRFPVAEAFSKILVFYFPLEDGIDLVRVIHGGRDLERLFAGWPGE